LRVAAIETGAVEDLYQLERGFTITVATQAAVLEAVNNHKQESARQLIAAQLSAYEYILDFATGSQPIVEAWIRNVHSVICSAQKTYTVQTAVGIQEHKLMLGEYKETPNNVVTSDNVLHANASPADTPAEMQRLVGILSSKQFADCGVVDQVSFAHYALVAIHPFADGNGRVTRALSSVFSYRALSVPLLIAASHRGEYFSALKSADHGDFLPFKRLVAERLTSTVLTLSQSIRNAELESLESVIQRVSAINRTKSGYQQIEIDSAADQLLQRVWKKFEDVFQGLPQNQRIGMVLGANRDSAQKGDVGQGFRRPVTGGGSSPYDASINLESPGQATVKFRLSVKVPRDCSSEDSFVIWEERRNEEIAIRVSHILPELSFDAENDIHLYARRVLIICLSELHMASESEARRRGY
jgi:Fic family protein